ncbi:F-box only protein 40 [Nothobranchius furzeri]
MSRQCRGYSEVAGNKRRQRNKGRIRATTMSADHCEHCDKCYDVYCPVQISVLCMVIKCRNNCGATFHKCKQEEHQLLCPNETVPCLNVDYGCPLSMLRHRLAKHLEVCPASAVCCSQEWNRWPIPDTDMTFYRNVSENIHSNSEVSLDVALALRDQALLFQSIKMKSIFPELALKEATLQNISAGVNSPAEEVSCSECSDLSGKPQVEEEKAPSQEERDVMGKSRDVASVQNYRRWENIFNKEKEGCNQSVKNVNGEGNGKRREERALLNSMGETRNCHGGEENVVTSRNVGGATGLAPWQDGVLERLSKEVNIAEYNMYLAHNGAMLINFGQLAACTPREKDFVYGNLEPIEVKTIRSFNVPKSYRAKRSFLKDPSHKAQTRHQSVDTTDLGLSAEDLPKSEEIVSALLCSLEKEQKGHLISATASTDGLFVDVGTQTYNFPSAPFKADASLADVTAERAHGLYVCVEEESVTRRHNKRSSAFSRTCGHFFRRDEYHSHFRNVHCDIQASLNGWFQQRCPLAYLGCTFTQIRFHPAGQQATIRFCQDVSAFKLQPQIPSFLCEGGKGFSPQGSVKYPDTLSRLPLEILQHIAGYLDSFTLSQLSRVSHIMRDVCATLLQERGMVFLEWKKKTYKHGGSSWKCRKKVWSFSSLFSPVERWSFSNTPSMSDHLKTCCFYQREERREPVALACLGEVKHGELKHQRSHSRSDVVGLQ